MTPPLPRLHAVTNDRIIARAGFSRRAGNIAQASAVALHLRAPASPGGRLVEVALTLKRVCDRSGSPFFVNDRADVLRAISGHGLHLPAHGIPLHAARELLGRDVWIGRSVHSAQEAIVAGEDGADYVFLGPIWETPSHPGRAGLGVDVISAVHGVKVIAIGGVTKRRIHHCLDAGAYGVAAVSSIWEVRDPAAAVRAMLLSLHYDTNNDRSRKR